MKYDERLIGKKPSDEHVKKSRARFDAMFKRRFELRQTASKEQRSIHNRTFSALRDTVKDHAHLTAAVKEAREQSHDHAKRKLHTMDRKKVQPRSRLGSVAVTFVPPFWPWQWDGTTGSASASESVDGNAGSMSFLDDTGDNGKTASSAVALGYYFQPLADNGILQVTANPAISCDINTWTVFDSAHAGGFVGLYVGEYTLQGDFVQAVVDQQLDLSSVIGGNQGSTSGFPLIAFTPCDSDHFYEIWVWAGGDAEADGWSAFWGSAALSSASFTVPSISVFAF
jgi:hypothetical protein